MIAWPYKPRDEVREYLEWATDIIKSKSAEQRLCLRDEPRRTFSMDHILSDYEYYQALTLVRSAQGVFQVPDWSQAQDIGVVSAGTTVYIDADLTYVDMGDDALLWESESAYEVVAIAEDSNGIYLDEVTGDYTRAKIMPLWDSVSPAGLSSDRIGARLNTCSADFTTTVNSDLSSTSYAQYSDLDVLPDCPVIRGLSEEMAWQLSTFDNTQSPLHVIAQRSYVDWLFTMSWTKSTRAEAYALRQWIHSRKGRQKAFWYSTWAKDFEPVSVSGTTLTVYAVNELAAPFHVEIVSGDSYYREVTSIAAGTPVAGRATLDLTIDSALTLSTIDRVSHLRCARFNADRVELVHRAPNLTLVTVPCVEIPQP